MIRTDKEYNETLKRIDEQQLYIDEQRQRLEGKGLTPEQIKRFIDPVICFHLQLVEEAEHYQRIKRGELDELRGLRGTRDSV